MRLFIGAMTHRRFKGTIRRHCVRVYASVCMHGRQGVPHGAEVNNIHRHKLQSAAKGFRRRTSFGNCVPST